jgi:hypothetical protein
MSNLINLMKNITSTESRENLKTLFAICLGTGSWILLGWLIYSQFNTSQYFSRQMILIPAEKKEQIALIKEANETVNKTANSLYALMMPIATAITGYFFISSGILPSKRSEENQTDPINPPKI